MLYVSDDSCGLQVVSLTASRAGTDDLLQRCHPLSLLCSLQVHLPERIVSESYVSTILVKTIADAYQVEVVLDHVELERLS